MKTLRCGVLVLLCSAALPWTAHAADILLDGEAPCLAIGGAWTSGTCTVDRLVVPAGTRLIAVQDVTLSTGDLLINGALEIFGGFEATRSVENRGTLHTYSYFVITAPMINRGMWDAYAGVWANNTFVNEWEFQNRSDFQIGSGVFMNWGFTINAPGSWFYGGFINQGVFYNTGSVFTSHGNPLDNFGAYWQYDGATFNDGTTIGRCGSVFDLSEFPYGLFEGNPIEFEPCQPSTVVAALGQSVFGLGQIGVLSKHDSQALSLLLSKAFQRLELGREAEAVAILHKFNAKVSARRYSYNSYVGGLLINQSNIAVQLITNP